MAKLIIVNVPAMNGIPAHTEQMTPEEAARLWESAEAQWRARQVQQAARVRGLCQIPPGSGAVLTAESPSMKVALQGMGLPAQEGPAAQLPFDRTLLWDPGAVLKLDLISAGLRFLDRWQVAVPLWSYTELARDIGEEAERDLTERGIRDLRVPAYDPRVLFLRKCKDTEDLLAAWRHEQSRGEKRRGGDTRLSFLRALYRVKPLILALPATWVQRP